MEQEKDEKVNMDHSNFKSCILKMPKETTLGYVHANDFCNIEMVAAVLGDCF